MSRSPRQCPPTAALAACAIVALVGALAAPPAAEAASTRKALEMLSTDLDLVRTTLESMIGEVDRLKEADADLASELQRKLAGIQEKQAATARVLSKLEQELRDSAASRAALEEEMAALQRRIDEHEAETNQLTRAVRLGAEMRVRGEYRNNQLDLSADGEDEELRYTHRLRLGLDITPTDWASLHVVAQDARVFGSDRSPDTAAFGASGAPRADDEGLGIHHAFLRLRPPLPAGHRLTLDAGRLTLAYGSGLLVGEDDWSMTGRAFDGGRLAYRAEGAFEADFFYTVVSERRTPLARDLDFLGLAFASPWFGDAFRPELLVLYLHDGIEGPARRKLTTISARVSGRPFAGFFYEAEAAIQAGSVARPSADGTDQGNVDRIATAYQLQLAYTIQEVAAAPTFRARLYAASGDGNPTDDKDVNFDPLFQDGYHHLDPMRLLRLTNLTLVQLGAAVKILPPLTFELHYFLALLSSDQGPLPGLGGPSLTEAGSAMGHEIFAALTYQRGDHLQLKLGYAAFLPGEAAESAVGGGDRADWVLAQAHFSF